MRLKIQTKLYIGSGFLFIATVLLWILSSVYLFRLSSDSGVIMKNNYQSIAYAKSMMFALDEIKNLQTKYFLYPKKLLDDNLYEEKLKVFEKGLVDEEHNITEAGEKELTVQLRVAYDNYLDVFGRAKSDSLFNTQAYFADLLPSYTEVRNHVNQVYDINMNAIIRKSNLLKKFSRNAFIFISILGVCCFVASFSILMDFPISLTKPIEKLTSGMREVSRKNYMHQLTVPPNNEFNEVTKAFNTMSVKLGEYESGNLSRILFEKKRIETIINRMNDAVIGLDEKKNIIFTNSLACKMIGLQPSELLGRYAPDIAAKSGLLQNVIKDLMNSNYKSKEFKTIKIFADEKESYFAKDIFDISSLDTKEESPILIGFVIILKDITKFQELDEAKTNFIATISHELKIPISSVRHNLGLLEDSNLGKLNDEQKSIVRTIKDQTSRLLNITGELLDMTQVETGNIQFNMKPVDPERIILYARDAMKFQAEQKGITIETDIPDNLLLINVDMDKTSWVLINLISNAITYSESKSKILVEAIENNDYITISVKDFGKGIDEKYLDKIFEKFFKVPGSKTGTGLGLAISKEFITKQKGKIWAESKLCEGSKFCFSLPVYSI